MREIRSLLGYRAPERSASSPRVCSATCCVLQEAPGAKGGKSQRSKRAISPWLRGKAACCSPKTPRTLLILTAGSAPTPHGVSDTGVSVSPWERAWGWAGGSARPWFLKASWGDPTAGHPHPIQHLPLTTSEAPPHPPYFPNNRTLHQNKIK